MTRYSKRSLTEVAQILNLNDEQMEQVVSILESDLNEMLSDKYQSPIDAGGGGGGGGGGSATVSDNVLRWKPLVVKYAIDNKIESYVSYILAQIQQESGGTHLDVLQCSESQGWAPGTITDPELSIKIGVKYFADGLKMSKYDVKIALQAYNFGHGFVDYAFDSGGIAKRWP